MQPTELRRRRLQRGLSIYDVAEAVGVKPPTVYRWESGERKIHPGFARLLELYFAGQLKHRSEGKGGRLKARK